MIDRTIRYLTVALILALVLYVVLMNREPFTVYISNNDSYTGMGGIILVAVFALGALCAGLIGLFFGFKTYLRERSFLSRERGRAQLSQGYIKARGLAAAHEWARARYEYEQIIKKHSDEVLARVELSRVLEQLGETREALQVLDAARLVDGDNIEVLFRAAELNVALKNRTAAIDNLALILSNEPNKRAAMMARDLSEDLERYDDAIEYENRLQELGVSGDDHDSIIANLEFKKTSKELISDPSLLRDRLAALVKRRPQCAGAFIKLGELDEGANKSQDAAQWYVKAARLNGDLDLWRKASNLWLSQNMPQQALAAARAATKESKMESRLSAEIELIRVYIALGIYDEARKAIAGFRDLARDLEATPTDEMLREILALDGLCSAKDGQMDRTCDALAALSEGKTAIEIGTREHLNGSSHDAPAPRLSTP